MCALLLRSTFGHLGIIRHGDRDGLLRATNRNCGPRPASRSEGVNDGFETLSALRSLKRQQPQANS